MKPMDPAPACERYEREEARDMARDQIGGAARKEREMSRFVQKDEPLEQRRGEEELAGDPYTATASARLR
jgi:hypothetical protein